MKVATLALLASLVASNDSTIEHSQHLIGRRIINPESRAPLATSSQSTSSTTFFNSTSAFYSSVAATSRSVASDLVGDAEILPAAGPSFTLETLHLGDRVTAEMAVGHVIEAAYFAAMFEQEYEGYYFYQAPSEIKYEVGKVKLCDVEGRLQVDIKTEERIEVANCTTICPTTSTSSCREQTLYEVITLQSTLMNTTGHSGLEDGTLSTIPAVYEYGLFYDAPGITPSKIASAVEWERAKEFDQPQIDSGEFMVMGSLAPNTTCEQRKELILKRIELTGTMSTVDCLSTEPLDDSATDSLHFRITACAHREADPSSACEDHTFGPFNYHFVIDQIHGKGHDNLLCRFEHPDDFCLMTLGLDKVQLSSFANFVATPAAYTNTYETINCIYREARSMTHYLPSINID